MGGTKEQFARVLERMGSDVTFHRETGGNACPCRSREGFRDPAWHRAHPSEPVCNEQGFLAATVTEFTVKASIQPAEVRSRSRPAERANDLLGDIERDDHIGIFPTSWQGTRIDFSEWSEAGEDYILYDGRRFIVIAVDKAPDIDGSSDHHFEVGLRLVRERDLG